MDFDKIKERNLEHIEYCVKEYNFKNTFEEVLALANVYSEADLNKKTIRLIGETKEIIDKKVKFKKIVLYSLTQSFQKFRSEEEVIETFKSISLIAHYHTQLKYLNKIEEIECDQVATCMKLDKILTERPRIRI